LANFDLDVLKDNEMNEAQQLLTALRAKNLSINRFLDLAKICPRGFYSWVQKDLRPSRQSKIKLTVALSLLEEIDDL
jgi:hypothetical protein